MSAPRYERLPTPPAHPVQYPNQTDPADTAKVIPNLALASQLMTRVQLDKQIALGKHALGVSATTANSPSPSTLPPDTGTATPKPAKSDHAVIAGLAGTTASQHTCTAVTRSRD